MDGKLNIDLPTELLRLKQGEVSYSYEELSALRAEIRGFTGRNQAIEDGQKEQD